jgi:hypothetical protein
MTNTNKVIDTMDFLIENNICVTDNICVFCSLRMDGWDRTCRRCRDYKGVMGVYQAVETYGTDIIGL